MQQWKKTLLVCPLSKYVRLYVRVSRRNDQAKLVYKWGDRNGRILQTVRIILFKILLAQQSLPIQSNWIGFFFVNFWQNFGSFLFLSTIGSNCLLKKSKLSNWPLYESMVSRRSTIQYISTCFNLNYSVRLVFHQSIICSF